MPRDDKYRRGSRRNMDKFGLGEISFVNVPAQEGATADIAKNGGEVITIDGLVASLSEDERYSDAEYGALKALILPQPMDGEARVDYVARVSALPAVRKALKPENAIAFAHATYEASADDLAKAGDLVDAMTESNEGHQHGISVYESGDGIALFVGYASGTENGMHDHQIVFMNGEYVMTENMGHTHDIDSQAVQNAVLAQLAKATDELKDAPGIAERTRLAKIGVALGDGSYPVRGAEDFAAVCKALTAMDNSAQAELAKHAKGRLAELGMLDLVPEQGDLADLFKSVEPSGGSVAQGDQPMPITEKELDALKAQNEQLAAVVALTTVQKAYYDELSDDAAKAAFLKKDDAEKEDEMEEEKAKKASDNPVVYKSDSGEVFHKSDDSRLVAMAKKMDADAKENAKLRKAAEDSALEKRANAELPNLPGSVEVKKALLKAVDGIEDEKVRTGAHDALKAHNTRMSGVALTEVRGSSEAPLEKVAGDKAEAERELAEMSKKRAETDGISYVDAYAKVGDENPALLAKAIAG